MKTMETRTITIDSIEYIKSKTTGEPIGLKIADNNGDRFTMWFTKKDGTISKAKEAWDGFKLGLGSTITVKYSEEDNVYKDPKTGETRKSKYPNRRIGTFLQEITPQSRMAQRVAELPPSPATDGEREIDVSQIPF